MAALNFPSSPVVGQTYSANNKIFEWNGTSWVNLTGAVGGGGATGGGADKVFYENDKTVTTSYTITTDKNSISAGPVTIDPGATVTIPAGSRWVIV